jgi:endonuclease YncB( thermonuclease family)
MIRQTAVAWLLLTASGCQSALAQSEIKGVASVIDGDTIEIHGQHIRIKGYDTPEEGKRCGQINVYQQASLTLSDFIGRRIVTCIDNGERNNGRVVAYCSVGGADLGDHIVSKGWGRDWPRYSQRKYADEEAAARDAKRGLWGLDCLADVWSGRKY